MAGGTSFTGLGVRVGSRVGDGCTGVVVGSNVLVGAGLTPGPDCWLVVGAGVTPKIGGVGGPIVPICTGLDVPDPNWLPLSVGRNGENVGALSTVPCSDGAGVAIPNSELGLDDGAGYRPGFEVAPGGTNAVPCGKG